MAEHTMKYGILVAVDGSAESDAAVRWAADAAVMHDSSVTLVHVVVPVVTSWPVRSLQAEFNAWQEDNARQVLDQAEKIARASRRRGPSLPIYAPRPCTTMSCPPWLMLRDTPRWSVGSRGMGAVGRAVLGLLPSSGLVHHVHCPVAIVHADESQAPGPHVSRLVGHRRFAPHRNRPQL